MTQLQTLWFNSFFVGWPQLDFIVRLGFRGGRLRGHDEKASGIKLRRKIKRFSQKRFFYCDPLM